jgi:hypothetical protein
MNGLRIELAREVDNLRLVDPIGPNSAMPRRNPSK